jgi:hypothetical protein
VTANRNPYLNFSISHLPPNGGFFCSVPFPDSFWEGPVRFAYFITCFLFFTRVVRPSDLSGRNSDSRFFDRDSETLSADKAGATPFSPEGFRPVPVPGKREREQ